MFSDNNNVKKKKNELGNQAVTISQLKYIIDNSDSGGIDSKIAQHNVAPDAHEDIRNAVSNASVAAGTAKSAADEAKSVADNAIALASQKVTTDKIADGAVDNRTLASGAVKQNNISDDAVTTSKIADKSVTADKIADGVLSGSSISLLDVYPVGSIYMSMSNIDPGTLFGGTWKKLEGRFLLTSDTARSAGTTGGSNDAVVVSHTHTGSTNSAGSHSHSGKSDTDGSHTHTISGGSHSHTGSTGSAGSHSHSMGADMLRVSNSATRCGSTASNIYWYVTQHYNTDSSGSHSHPVTVTTSSSHSHGMTSAGSHYHILTIDSNGSHSHSVTIDSAGVSGKDKNMPAYMVVNAWQRTA